jgi:hypothetical protein
MRSAPPSMEPPGTRRPPESRPPATHRPPAPTTPCCRGPAEKAATLFVGIDGAEARQRVVPLGEDGSEVDRGGRCRWKIETEGFKLQKNGGFHLEQAYSTRPPADHERIPPVADCPSHPLTPGTRQSARPQSRTLVWQFAQPGQALGRESPQPPDPRGSPRPARGPGHADPAQPLLTIRPLSLCLERTRPFVYAALSPPVSAPSTWRVPGHGFSVTAHGL